MKFHFISAFLMLKSAVICKCLAIGAFKKFFFPDSDPIHLNGTTPISKVIRLTSTTVSANTSNYDFEKRVIRVYGSSQFRGWRMLCFSDFFWNFVGWLQTDIFAVEAVHLGCLYKIVIGHNGLGSGQKSNCTLNHYVKDSIC